MVRGAVTQCGVARIMSRQRHAIFAAGGALACASESGADIVHAACRHAMSPTRTRRALSFTFILIFRYFPFDRYSAVLQIMLSDRHAASHYYVTPLF
jgi:hypothetical protein